MDIRHILAPTDFSDYSKKALSDALDLAQTFGAKLSLLHVIEPRHIPSRDSSWPWARTCSAI